MRRTVAVALVLCCVGAGGIRAQTSDTSLTGLWYAKRWFGPELRGELQLRQMGGAWQTVMGSRTANVRVARDSFVFDMPSGGSFRGRLSRNGAQVTAHAGLCMQRDYLELRGRTPPSSSR